MALRSVLIPGRLAIDLGKMITGEGKLAALARAEGLRGTASGIARLGEEFGDEAARWAVGQWELRRRGEEKFARAPEMLFTRAGLEMATHERVAQWHAGLFPDGVLVADLSCGIGADLGALAHRGPVVGVDLDEEHGAYAKWNLGVWGVEGEVVCGDSVAWARENQPEYVFVDPARRAGGRRLVDPAEFSPSVADLEPVLKEAKRAVVKLSPMLDDSFLKRWGGDLWFVSFGRECREAVVVLGEGVSGTTRVVRVESGAVLEGGTEVTVTDEVGEWIYEADPAAVRGHALGGFGLRGLGDGRGYLTGAGGVESEWLRGFRVVWTGSWRAKAVSEALRELGARVEVVKTRGVKDDPATVRKGLKGYGSRELVLMLFRAGKKERAVLTEEV